MTCSDPPPARIVATSGLASGRVDDGGAVAFPVEAVVVGDGAVTGLVMLEDVQAMPPRTRRSTSGRRDEGKARTDIDASSTSVDRRSRTREDVVMTMRAAQTMPFVILLVAVACTAASTAAPVPSASGPASSPSEGGHSLRIRGAWPTYHGDPARSGAAAGPPLGDVRHAWTSPTLDGDVYAEPLVVGRLVVTATENDTVYALDATSGRVMWRAHVGEPVQSSTLPCGNIAPVSGITATPVVDPRAGLIYAGAFVSPARHELFALRLRSGAVVWHRPIDPPGMDPTTQQLRSALTLANGRVTVAYGGLFGDCGSYHGWVASVAADGSGSLIDYRAPTVNAGGIWAPSGPAVGSDGTLYVTTGNSFSSAFDHGDSVIALSPTLREMGFFAPTDWRDLNTGDADLGSVGPAVLPGDRIFQIGKGGVGYLLDAADLGGIGGELASAQVCDTAAFGGTAHAGDTVYVPCGDGLAAVRVADDRLTVAWRSERFDAGPPIVAGGLVWIVDLGNPALIGLDPDGGAQRIRIALDDASHFASPASAPGCVFVPTRETITAFCIPGAS
jgi:outer membrane protein assembly factor BamB